MVDTRRDPAVNQIKLWVGDEPPALDPPPDTEGGEQGFPCCMLPPEINGAPADRESYVDLGPGHLPCRARVWMSKSQLEALPQGVRSGSDPVGIQITGMALASDEALDNFPTGVRDRALNFFPHFYLLDATIARGSIDGEALYEVQLATIQHWWMFKNLNLAFNMLSDDCLFYMARAKGPGDPFTYQDIADQIGEGLDVDFGTVPRERPMSTGSPHNFVIRHIPGGMAIARLLRPLGMEVTFNPFAPSGGASLFDIVRLDVNQDAFDVTPELEAFSTFAAEDGVTPLAADMTPRNRMPESVRVLYPKCPLPPMDKERYCIHTRMSPDKTGAIKDTEDTIFVGDHNCVCDENQKQYKANENLPEMATERAEAYFNRANIPFDTYVFNGHYQLRPGSSIRRVRITADIDGTHTTVWRHGLWDAHREDFEIKFNRIQAPKFPEHGEPFNIEVDPRDDGTIDIRHPFLGDCSSSSSSVSGSSSSGSSGSSLSSESESSESQSSFSESSASQESSLGSASSSSQQCPDGCTRVLKDVDITFDKQKCVIEVIKIYECVKDCPEPGGEP